LFSTDVNSPLKPPPQNNKDGGAQGQAANGRKTSISQGSGAFGLSSPASASRPVTRRQQTSDSISGMQSPSGTGRFSRDEMSPFFVRKANELKDDLEDRPDEKPSMLPFGGLARSNTAGSALGNGPASPWGAPSATSMGNFGNFSLANAAAPPTPIDKRPAFGRGESRLAHLMPKASTEDMSKPAERSWRTGGRQRTDTADTDPFSGEAPSGSAALGGGQDSSPPLNAHQRLPTGMDTPIRGTSSEFGMSDMLAFRERGQSQQTPQGHHEEHDEMSPSITNPYRSPPDNRHDADDSSYDGPLHHDRQGLGGIPEHGSAFGTLNRGYPNVPYDGSDRSQNSSAGATRGFPPTLSGLSSLAGLGGGGWPTSSNPLGTPDRENRPGFSSSAFGTSLFGGMSGDLQSPGFGPHSGMHGSSSTGGAGRGGIRSLFPPAMQAQMQGGETEDQNDNPDLRSSNAFGTIGRNAFPSRDTDSPMRTGRHAFDDFPQSIGPESTQAQVAAGFPQVSSAQSNHQPSQASSDSASGTLPAAQMRSMVMPDRMRWVYLDPQGTTQGPWSGLEMHDWYKASFFTADLMVKKVEDEKFEPLGSMIRRIGNSREPFLVPQIGIAHGPPTTTAGAPFVPATAGPGNSGAQPGAVQPPFANSFPSFGTTLTAEQQNNLERRKQEEQFLMARQREFLAQQQVNMKQMQMSGLPSTLHHHSSAHSLQSQPSFGSMTSPIGLHPQPPIPGVAGFFDGPPRPMPTQGASGITPDFFREDELARLSIQDRQQLFGAAAQGPQHSVHAQQIAAMFPQPQRQSQNEPDFGARLQEFQTLRAEHDREEANQVSQPSAPTMNEPIGPPQSHQQHNQFMYEEPSHLQHQEDIQEREQEALSLTQRVQQAASVKESPTTAVPPESPWGKVNTGLPMPFPPPPQSTTPLPAPTAQRNRSNLPEALSVETRSRSETPEVASANTSVAPWAKEPVEAPKGPSLKEIQEAEARKAAKAEEIAAAARRANYEQELKMLATQPAALAPGLPTTSTWGNSASPAIPTNAPSAWTKPAASKVIASSNTASSKKTLADIQREEELRKQKVAAAAAAQPTPGVSGGKRYADLASKSTPAIGVSAWTTVGTGGKARVPTGPVVAIPPAVRAVSSTNVATISTPRAARPAATTRSATTSGQSNVIVAKEEFIRWTKAALANKLNAGINGMFDHCEASVLANNL
jgi:PERQ amino acid-rich with GYF domain-containing protein